MSSREGREFVLHSSRDYYAHRATYYDLWSQRHRKDPQTARELGFIELACKKDSRHKVREIFDVACGGGRHVVGLAKRGYKCTGHDFTAERIQTAKARAKRLGVSISLRRGDATRLRFTKEFDAVLALYIIFLLPNDEDIQRCLKGIHRALRPGGIIVSNIFNPFTSGKTWISQLLTKGEMVESVRARGVRITEIMKVRSLDAVHGVMWVDETSFVEAPDGRHVFRDRERVRLLTYWEMLHHLEKAGFSNIRCYPDWSRKQAKTTKAEQLVFIGQK